MTTNGSRNGVEIAIGKPRARRRAYDTKSNGRSRVSNGKELLPDVDGRSLLARRYRDIAHDILAEQGGSDASAARQQLIRRFAAAACLAEQMESRLVNGEQIDIQQHSLLVSSLVRLANKLGINRVAKDITPTIDEYLRSKRDMPEAAE